MFDVKNDDVDSADSSNANVENVYAEAKTMLCAADDALVLAIAGASVAQSNNNDDAHASDAHKLSPVANAVDIDEADDGNAKIIGAMAITGTDQMAMTNNYNTSKYNAIIEANHKTTPTTKYTANGNGNTNLTSIASMERCNTIRFLLEEQHRKYQPRRQQHQTQKHSHPQREYRAGSKDIEGHPIQKHHDDLDDEDACDNGNKLWWADDDSYNLSAFNQINGIWPLGHPLPLPDWAPSHAANAAAKVTDSIGNEADNMKAILHFDSVWQYEDLMATIETILQRMLAETHYDTVNLFIDFYRAFKRTRRSDLRSFFQFYDIPINRRHHMCVSLAMEVMTRLVRLFPVLAHYLYIVSCEEQVMSLSDYIETVDELGGLNATHANVEKEHAMVAMKIRIAGRDGIMILDPGYHVARAVTVMSDQLYPHTGWFTQSKEPFLQRDYCYNYCMHSHEYVEWLEREVRGDKTTYKSSLVYIDKPYVTAIDVTVRRNLVYNFRSLLARTAKGRVYAGIYFPLVANVSEAHFTLFYDDDGPNEERVKVKFMFNVFKNPNKIPENVQQHLSKLAPQLHMEQFQLRELCKSIAETVLDQAFIQQVLDINNDIGNMSAEN